MISLKPFNIFKASALFSNKPDSICLKPHQLHKHLMIVHAFSQFGINLSWYCKLFHLKRVISASSNILTIWMISNKNMNNINHKLWYWTNSSRKSKKDNNFHQGNWFKCSNRSPTIWEKWSDSFKMNYLRKNRSCKMLI